MRDILPEPTYWLALIAILIFFLLTFHPQSGHFRRALGWIRKNPAPLLLLAASHTLLAGLQLWPGMLHEELNLSPYQPLVSPLEQWLSHLAKGWQQFTQIFHHAITPPPVLFNPVLGACIQAFIAAFSQIWLCRILINSFSPFLEDWLAFRQLLSLMPAIFILTLLYFPWWFLQRPGAPASSDLLRILLLPQTFLFLAPIPFLLASGLRSFREIGHRCMACFKNHLAPLLSIACCGSLSFTLLHHSLSSPQSGWADPSSPFRIVSSSLLASFLQHWIFLGITFLLLPTLLKSPQNVEHPMSQSR